MKDASLLVAVFAILEREGTVSIPQLSRLLDASEDEVWEALDVLVFCYDSVSVRLDLHGAHATLEVGGGRRLLRLNEDETDVLLDALMAQGLSPDDGLVAKLLETKGFFSGDSTEMRPLPRVRTVSAGNAGGIVETVAAACDDPGHHLLAIEYQKEGAPKAERRVVEPYELVSRDESLYLHAYCHDAAGWRSFRTDRIKSAEMLDRTYDQRDDVPELTRERRAGSRTAHVRFKAGTAPPSWPGIVAGRENEDGSRDARVPWLGGLWLPKHIAGMLGAAVPLDPPELVEATRAYAKQLLAGQK